MDYFEIHNNFKSYIFMFYMLLSFGLYQSESKASPADYAEYDTYDLMEAPTIAEISSTKFISNQVSLEDLECGEKFDEENYLCFEMTCHADGRPSPEILWYLNDHKITDENENFVLNGNVLTSLSKGTIKPRDGLAGAYYCLAKNIAGRKPSEKLYVNSQGETSSLVNPSTLKQEPENGSEPPTISVFENPKFENHQILLEDIKCDDVDCVDGSGECDDYDMQHGCNLELTCNVKGKPAPLHQWFHNDKPIESRENGLILNEETKSLNFIRMGSSDPDKEWKGSYHCVAESSLGKAKSEVMYIRDEDFMIGDSSKAPKIINPALKDGNNYVPYGNSKTLSCEFENMDEPYDIEWTKNGDIIKDNNNENDEVSQLIETLADGKIKIDGVNLRIKHFDDSSKGTYACNVSNAYGYSYHNVFLGILNESPSFLESPIPPELHTGQTMILECQARGFPIPDIVWKFKSRSESEFTDITKRSDACSFLQIRLGDTNNCKQLNIENTTDSNVVMSVLTIEKINIDDSGVYQCEAINDKTVLSGEV